MLTDYRNHRCGKLFPYTPQENLCALLQVSPFLLRKASLNERYVLTHVWFILYILWKILHCISLTHQLYYIHLFIATNK